jgi:hypothetical protein
MVQNESLLKKWMLAYYSYGVICFKKNDQKFIAKFFTS